MFVVCSFVCWLRVGLVVAVLLGWTSHPLSSFGFGSCAAVRAPFHKRSSRAQPSVSQLHGSVLGVNGGDLGTSGQFFWFLIPLCKKKLVNCPASPPALRPNSTPTNTPLPTSNPTVLPVECVLVLCFLFADPNKKPCERSCH